MDSAASTACPIGVASLGVGTDCYGACSLDMVKLQMLFVFVPFSADRSIVVSQLAADLKHKVCLHRLAKVRDGWWRVSERKQAAHSN